MDAGLLLLDGLDDLDDHIDAVLGGAEHLHQGVDVDLGSGNAVLLGLDHQLVKDPQAVIGGLGDSLAAQQGHHLPGRTGDGREDDVALVTLHGNGVDHTGLLAEFHRFHADMGVGAVDADGRVGDFLHQVDEPVEGFNLVVFDGCADVDEIGALLGLNLGQIANPVGVTLGDGLGDGRDGTIDLFTNDDHDRTSCKFSL